MISYSRKRRKVFVDEGNGFETFRIQNLWGVYHTMVYMCSLRAPGCLITQYCSLSNREALQ